MASSLGNNENLATDQHHVPEQEMLEVNGNDGNEENSKRRKCQSDVWNEMTKYRRKDTEKKDWEEMTKNLRKDKEKEDIDVLAQCNHCKSVFDGSSKKGTTHLKNHLERCRKKGKGGEDAQKSIRTSNLTSTDVIQETSLMDWIKTLFDKKRYPTEDFKLSLLNSRKDDILEAYQEEKEKLRKFFSQLSCRISLRIDCLNDWQLVTANYIDENWKQNTTLIGVLGDNDCPSSSLIEAVKDLCLDLKIDGNICSVVVDGDDDDGDDDDDDDDDVIGEINRWFTQKGSLPFGGFLVLDQGCFGDIQRVSSDSYRRIRDCTEFVHRNVHRTLYNQCKFEISVNNVKSKGKKLASEPLPTTVFSSKDLEISLRYKEAFFELERIDPDFKSINLTREQWDEATELLELEKSIEKALSFSISNSTTPNMYFSKFCDLYKKLLQAERSSGYLVGKNNSSRLTQRLASMKQKFIDNYWSTYNLFLVITVILDPRFKMEIVQLWYNEIYGCDADLYLEKIVDDFKMVYNEYAERTERSSISYLDAMGRPCSSSHNVISPKSELDVYLNDPKYCSVEKFDILSWWCLHSSIFPTLARMARDFLAVPISSSSVRRGFWDAIELTADRFEYVEFDERSPADLKRAFVYIYCLCLMSSL